MKYITILPLLATLIVCSVTAVEFPYLRLSDDVERDKLEPLKFCLAITRKGVNNTAVFDDVHLQTCQTDCDNKCKGKENKPQRNLMKDLQWFPWDNKVMGLGTDTYGRCLQVNKTRLVLDAAECDKTCGQKFCWDTDGSIKYDNEGDFSWCIVAGDDSEIYDKGKFKALPLKLAKCADHPDRLKRFTY